MLVRRSIVGDGGDEGFKGARRLDYTVAAGDVKEKECVVNRIRYYGVKRTNADGQVKECGVDARCSVDGRGQVYRRGGSVVGNVQSERVHRAQGRVSGRAGVQ
ncbi:hypothetical protein IG631_09618 [Alternaria alternata]|nr:hypothetical protein IG631_09618 [Alternaria alternata]